MADIFDYFLWRGDLTLDQIPFNELDGMILARFAYIPFEHFSRPLTGQPVPIRDIARDALDDGALAERWKMRDRELLERMAASARFGDMLAGWHVSRLDERVQTQFSAVTVLLGDGRAYVAYRGTDNTVVGWKEDLNMSYLCPIPGQEMAAEYADETGARFGGRLLLGGHSKGGNLAMYAGAFCSPAVQERIDTIYNYDGPGFFDEILEREAYRRIAGRIATFVPQSSVVGMLLNHPEGHTVVHSTEKGLSQHDVYSWQLVGPRFDSLETVTGGSRFVDGAIKEWIAGTTPEQFEQFADTVYSFMTGTQMATMHEMKENWFDTAVSFVRTVAGMEDDTRAAALGTLKLLAKSAAREAKEEAAEILQGS